MATIKPWHARGAKEHHNNTECPIGKEVARIDFMDGDGGKPLCLECKRLNDPGKREASIHVLG